MSLRERIETLSIFFLKFNISFLWYFFSNENVSIKCFHLQVFPGYLHADQDHHQKRDQEPGWRWIEVEDAHEQSETHTNIEPVQPITVHFVVIVVIDNGSTLGIHSHGWWLLASNSSRWLVWGYILIGRCRWSRNWRNLLARWNNALLKATEYIYKVNFLVYSVLDLLFRYL